MKYFIAILLTAASFAAGAVNGQTGNPDPPRNVEAVWSLEGSSVVNVKWTEPQSRPSGIYFYAVYETQGDATTQLSPVWHQLTITTLTNATFDLQALGLQAGSTMSFEVYAEELTLHDTLRSVASNIAVAVWKTALRDTLIFVSQPVLSGMVGVKYSYQARAINIGVNTTGGVTYSLSTSPSGMSIDAKSGIISWLPDSSGTYGVTILAVSKNGDSVQQSFSVIITGGFGTANGMVTDSVTGKGIAGAVVTFQSIAALSGPAFEATTNMDGSFSIPMREGKYLVFAAAQGYMIKYWDNVTGPGSATIITVTGGDTTTLAFPLVAQAKGNLIVHVVDDSGRGIAGVTITSILKSRMIGIADNLFPWYGKQTTMMTDSSGVATFTLLPAVYLVRADADGYLSIWYGGSDDIHAAQIVQVTANDTASITFRLIAKPMRKLATISGTVYASGTPNSPLANARVTFSFMNRKGDDIDDRDDDDDFTVTVFTNDSGNYVAVLPLHHTYIAFAVAKGYDGMYFDGKMNPQEADRIHLDTDIVGINFVLLKTVPYSSHIKGMVVGLDSLGAPLASRVTAFMNSGDHFVPVSTTIADSTGVYAFDNLPPGTYIIHAVPFGRKYVPGYYTGSQTSTTDWHKALRVPVVNGTSDSNMTIYLKPARPHKGFLSISGDVDVIVDAENIVKLCGATILVIDIDGNIVAGTTSDIDGSFTFDSLDVGTYTLTIDKVEYSVVAQQQVSVDYDKQSSPSTTLSAAKDAPLAVGGGTYFVPNAPILAQNYPNPGRIGTGEATTIEYTLATRAPVEIDLFNVAGEKVATLAWGDYDAGIHRINVSTNDLHSGVYFYRLISGETTVTREMVLVR